MWGLSICCLQMQDDHELNQLLHLAAADTVELEAALHSHQQRVLQALNMQLLPCGSAAAEAAQAAVGQQKREVGVVEKLPLLDLTEPVLVTGSHATQAGNAGAFNAFGARFDVLHAGGLKTGSDTANVWRGARTWLILPRLCGGLHVLRSNGWLAAIT